MQKASHTAWSFEDPLPCSRALESTSSPLHQDGGWHESPDSEVISEQEIKMEAVQHVSNGGQH